MMNFLYSKKGWMNLEWETVYIPGWMNKCRMRNCLYSRNEWMNEGWETVYIPGWMNEWRMGNCLYILEKRDLNGPTFSHYRDNFKLKTCHL